MDLQDLMAMDNSQLETMPSERLAPTMEAVELQIDMVQRIQQADPIEERKKVLGRLLELRAKLRMNPLWNSPMGVGLPISGISPNSIW